MKFGFCWIGLVVFLLPMLINLVYVLLPPKDGGTASQDESKVLTALEQGSRIAYLLALCLLVWTPQVSVREPWCYLALACLALYYVVWLRYFCRGRRLALLGARFLGVPQPLAVFPVLYFLFAAVWLRNPVAFCFMVVFGVVHNVITYQNLHRDADRHP